MKRKLTPEELGRICGRIGGGVGSIEDKARAGRIAGHERWHVARRMLSPRCELCRTIIKGRLRVGVKVPTDNLSVIERALLRLKRQSIE
jgi:hypothetical protein